ncbi:universal stress protein [Rhizobiales bacterium RZME27]|jgi:nucleotide-binding universal stress UspA family protein|uniref:Universal stress protein n=1 Tax=Endobacterium cereale TaxID=2663029 RepID=A0A6A8A2W5_9HYPH|nr:universal stress protein [Endobacterium cereale]MEB2844685.1 universal stress protein [Endobacterium cereale]MQY45492.1 universal stress protein [Endobacterium cereale]
MYKHILIPTDGSELATEALEKALDLAVEMNARATVLVVVEPLQAITLNPSGLEIAYAEYDRQVDQAADGILAEAKAAAEQRGVSVDVEKITNTNPAQVIVDVSAKHACDLIAIGSRGRSGISAFMLGSVTLKVLALTKTPVLVYR